MRQDDGAVGSYADIASKRQAICIAPDGSSCAGVVAGYIDKICTESRPVTIESHIPGPSTRETEGVICVAGIGKVYNHDDIIARAAILPAVESDELIGIVDMINIDMLAT